MTPQTASVDPLMRERQRARARLLCIAWLVLGAALAAFWWLSWQHPAAVKDVIGSIQAAIGSGEIPFALRVDGWLHAAVSATVTLWLSLGCAVVLPGCLLWLPALGALLIALADEALQLGSGARAVELSDLGWDALGIALAWPCALLLRNRGPAGGAALRP